MRQSRLPQFFRVHRDVLFYVVLRVLLRPTVLEFWHSLPWDLTDRRVCSDNSKSLERIDHREASGDARVIIEFRKILSSRKVTWTHIRIVGNLLSSPKFPPHVHHAYYTIARSIYFLLSAKLVESTNSSTYARGTWRHEFLSFVQKKNIHTHTLFLFPSFSPSLPHSHAHTPFHLLFPPKLTAPVLPRLCTPVHSRRLDTRETAVCLCFLSRSGIYTFQWSSCMIACNRKKKINKRKAGNDIHPTVSAAEIATNRPKIRHARHERQWENIKLWQTGREISLSRFLDLVLTFVHDTRRSIERSERK